MSEPDPIEAAVAAAIRVVAPILIQYGRELAAKDIEAYILPDGFCDECSSEQEAMKEAATIARGSSQRRTEMIAEGKLQPRSNVDNVTPLPPAGRPTLSEILTEMRQQERT